MRLSIVELATVAPGTTEADGLADAILTAQDAEALGLYRAWFAEHHLSRSHASHHPELLIAMAGARPTDIRLGSGAVLLNHYSPFKVAEMSSSWRRCCPAASTSGSAARPAVRSSTPRCASTVAPTPSTTTPSASARCCLAAAPGRRGDDPHRTAGATRAHPAQHDEPTHDRRRALAAVRRRRRRPSRADPAPDARRERGRRAHDPEPHRRPPRPPRLAPPPGRAVLVAAALAASGVQVRPAFAEAQLRAPSGLDRGRGLAFLAAAQRE